MRTLIIFSSLLLFFTFMASSLYSAYCYMQYRSLWPRDSAAGFLIGLRAALQLTHDPNDPNLSNECKMYFGRAKSAVAVAVLMMLLIVILVLLGRSFGIQQVLDQ
jgi:hypothetical protein